MNTTFLRRSAFLAGALSLALLADSPTLAQAAEDVPKAAPGDHLNAAEELTKQEHASARVLASNDSATIGKWLRDDWTYIGTSGEVVSKADFVNLLESGTLKFESYEVHDL